MRSSFDPINIDTAARCLEPPIASKRGDGVDASRARYMRAHARSDRCLAVETMAHALRCAVTNLVSSSRETTDATHLNRFEVR
jgi:hypothetical protein